MLRFAFVDALRAIAALSVLIFHAAAGQHIPILYSSLPPALQWIISHSNAGVAIFFVISGFVIAHSLYGVDLTASSAGRFMFKRSLRLDPPYWATIALLALIAIVKQEPMFSGGQLMAHLVYVQDLYGMPPISPVFWTLCLEFQFYLVFALLQMMRSSAAIVGAFVLSIPLSLVVLWPGLFTNLWYGFLIGALARIAWQQPAAKMWFMAYLAILQTLAIVRSDLFMAVCVLTGLALYVAAIRERLATTLNWRWLQFLGAISYSIYLIHNPATGAAFRIANKFLGESVVGELVSLVLALCLSIAAAAIMWLLVERPSIRLSRMFSASSPEMKTNYSRSETSIRRIEVSSL